MRYAYSASIKLALTAVMAGLLLPATLSAYIINGSTVTLTASDRISDNTSLIQGFLNNATYTKIIIQPGAGNASWPVRPLFFNHSSTEIHLDANTVLEALAGGYPNGSDCVLKATSLNNIKVTGDSGARILMHKDEYAALAAAEWRHALNFMSCSNVTVSDVTLASTGGDGIYLGDATGTGYCSNVIITNVTVDGAARNGLSVISVDGLTVTGCTFKNTQGQGNAAAGGPWAGIDLEPNNSSEQLRNIVVDNCAFLNNGYCGFLQYTPMLSGSSGVLSMTVKNCTMQGNTTYGVRIAYVPASLSDSSNEAFQDCIISDNRDMGVWVAGKDRDSGSLAFTNCYLKNNNLSGSNTAFSIYNFSTATEIGGNIQLNNIVIEQPTNRAVSYFLHIDGTYGSIDNVSGTVYASGGALYTANTTNINVATASSAAQSYWKTDETVGAVANDSNGNCDGTLQNSPAWATGRIGGGLILTGTNQFVSVTNDASLNISTGDFSASLWFQRSNNAVTNNRLLYKGASDTTEIGYAVSGSNTALMLLLSNGVTRITTTCAIPSLDQWHHFAFTVNRSSGKAKLYMNGVYQTELNISAYSGGDISNTRDLLIGAANSSGWLAWPGKVDDIRIYKRVLSADEVVRLYSATP